MGTRMQDESRRILNALDEGKVFAVITLYDKGLLNSVKYPKRYVIKAILERDFEMTVEDADYWLDWFNVKE
jgi:hypothetical protein